MQKPSVEELVAAFCAEAKEKALSAIQQKEDEKREYEQYQADRFKLVKDLHTEFLKIFKFFIDRNLIEVSPVREKENGDVSVSIALIEEDVLEDAGGTMYFGVYKTNHKGVRSSEWTYYASGFKAFSYPHSYTNSRDEFLVRMCQCAGKSLAKYQLR